MSKPTGAELIAAERQRQIEVEKWDAQSRRRERARELFRVAAEIADARYIPMRDAFRIARKESRWPWGLPAT